MVTIIKWLIIICLAIALWPFILLWLCFEYFGWIGLIIAIVLFAIISSIKNNTYNVRLDLESLTMHTFITGSTGSDSATNFV